MPRRSAADLSTVSPRVDGRRAPLPAPADLSGAARKVWLLCVRSVPGDHFRESDSPLLRSYAEATVIADRAAAELGASGPVVGGRVSPWLTVLEKAHRSQAVLAVRLRLCPSSRSDPKSVGRERVEGPRVDWEAE